MADDFDSGLNWWSTARTSSAATTSFDSSATAAASASCSPAIAMDSSSLPAFGMDWNQTLLRSSNSCDTNMMLQESMSYPSIEATQFLIDHQNLQQPQPPPPGLSMMLQGLMEPPEASAGCLQFANNAAYWNAPAGAVLGEARTGFYAAPMPVQFGSAQTYDQKPSCSSLTNTANSDIAQKRGGGGGGEPALKKSRIETPSPLPTFKVRKEKLGDRITALQQLVSPFGKTDTASVLHEAIEYIKFLHEQVGVLSTPYLKNGHPMQHQQRSDKSKEGEGPKLDLRSRGLCLVPIESTYPVASETTADFWTPTFGGTYR